MSEFSIAAVFSDNMVIQRNKNINVFGYGTDGAEVTVVFCGNKSSSVIKDGKWNVVLPPVSKGEKLEMTVRKYYHGRSLACGRTVKYGTRTPKLHGRKKTSQRR